MIGEKDCYFHGRGEFLYILLGKLNISDSPNNMQCQRRGGLLTTLKRRISLNSVQQIEDVEFTE